MGKNVRVWIKKVKTHKRVEAYQNIHHGFTHPHLGCFDLFIYLFYRVNVANHLPTLKRCDSASRTGLKPRRRKTSAVNAQLQVSVRPLLSQRNR